MLASRNREPVSQRMGCVQLAAAAQHLADRSSCRLVLILGKKFGPSPRARSRLPRRPAVRMRLPGKWSWEEFIRLAFQ
jgi:hypothetical protein